ncbi:MAG: radical SAM protein [Candidatus Aenigmatarchaeota archaeon]
MNWRLKDPKRIQIQPSYKCNLNCKFCWKTIHENGSLEEMSDEKWLEITENLCDLDIDKVIISGGGEPLMRKTLISKLIKNFKENDIGGSLVTNGTLFDRKLINTTIENHWDEINISLHSPRVEINDFLRDKEGSTKKTLENIKKINKLKEKKEKPRITINAVINEYNYDHLEEFKKFAQEFKIDHVIFRLLQGNPKDCKFVPKDKLEILLEKLRKIKPSKKTNFHFSFSENEVENYYE